MDYYDIKAKEQERVFFKHVAAGSVFHTGSGRENVIVDVTPQVIYFRTTKSKSPVSIPRERFRAAIRHLFYRRTATRKELEGFNRFNSALMGLLRLVFADIARIKRTIRGLLRITLRSVRFIFSGLDRAPKDVGIVRAYGGLMGMVSFANVRFASPNQWKLPALEVGLDLVCDSGEFTRFRAARRGKYIPPIRVEDYGLFLQRHLDAFFMYFNLDVIGDPKTSQWNADYLRDQGLSPVEVWHCQSPWEELEKLLRKDLPIIGIGGTALMHDARERWAFFEDLFRRYPNENFHLLGGASKFAAMFPWVSADSSSWLNGRMYGELITPHRRFEAPKSWTPRQCVAFNVEQMSQLEDNYNRNFPEIQFPLTPPLERYVEDLSSLPLFA